MLDKAFDALKTYDWGANRNALNPIDEAVVIAHGDPAVQKELESQLAAVLKTDVSRDAKDFVCRKLMVIGTAASVPALAELLPEKDHSHMARYALERIPAPEAAQAMRDALPKVSGSLKVGLIASLGVRRDAASVPALAALLEDIDPAVARAAAFALGDIRAPEAAKALAEAAAPHFVGVPAGLSPEAAKALADSIATQAKLAVADATLACAEGLVAEGKKSEALALYKRLVSGGEPKHVRLAATRGMLTCAGKKE